MTWADFVPMEWRGWLEVLILWLGIYYAWRSIRGTRGARVLMGLALLILFIATLAGFFDLPVLSWMFRNITTAFIFTLIVIFQPEVRRALAAIGSNKLFTSASSSQETIELITETTFDLANRQLGALFAIERDQNLEPDFGLSRPMRPPPEFTNQMTPSGAMSKRRIVVVDSGSLTSVISRVSG